MPDIRKKMNIGNALEYPLQSNILVTNAKKVGRTAF